MKRSGGVTASAILAIVGSAGCILFGVLTIVSAATLRNLPPQAAAPNMPVSPIAPAVSLALAALFCLGSGAWGIASAIGLLRLRPWARLCFMVFGGLLAVGSLFGALSLFVASRVPQTLPPGSNIPPGVLSGIMIGLAVCALLCAGLGVVWAVFFNRRTVKLQFVADVVEEAPPGQFPLSISIIAWLMIAGGLFAIPNLLVGYPLMLFGFVFHGWGARAFSILMAAINLAAGTGLLRKRIEAHALAVAIYVFGLVNLLGTMLIPGSTKRMQDYLAEVQPGQPLPAMMEEMIPVAAAAGGIAVGALLWLLITRRQAYFAACNPPDNPQANQQD